MEYKKAEKTAIEWLIDTTEYYIGARCLAFNQLLTAGLFLGSIAIEKYLKTILITCDKPIIKSGKKGHNLIPLYEKAIEYNILIENNETKNIIKYFDGLKNNFAYIEGNSRKNPPYNYATNDILN